MEKFINVLFVIPFYILVGIAVVDIIKSMKQ